MKKNCLLTYVILFPVDTFLAVAGSLYFQMEIKVVPTQGYIWIRRLGVSIKT
jgi:hypothetical protein